MMHPRTPIRIINGEVRAYILQQKRKNGLPVFKLGKPKPGMWRNGRVLRHPYHCNHWTEN